MTEQSGKPGKSEKADKTDKSDESDESDESDSETGTGAGDRPKRKTQAERKARNGRARTLRRTAFETRFTANRLAVAGAILSLVFLFQHSLVVKSLMLVAFIAATWYSGKRFSLIGTLFVSATIIAANLLLPFGKVLIGFGPIVITQGALLGGIEKAVTFEGLMYASKACILPTLKLPGRFGSVVARAFVYYDRIVEYKGRIRPASLVADADALMLQIWESET